MVPGMSSSTFVFVSSRRGPTMGRVERRMLRVMAALIESGAQVNLICTPRSQIDAAARELGVEVAPYHLDRLNYFRTRSRVKKYLQRQGAAIVHSTGLEGDLIARWAAHTLPAKAVDSMTCIDWPRSGPTALSRAVRRYLDASSIDDADAIVVDCHGLGDRLTAAGVPAERILYDPPSIDIPEILAQAEEPWRPPERPAGPLVGYGGRIQAARGLENLVAASAILEARGALAEVVIAGEGPLLQELQADARSSRVRYLGYVESVPAVLAKLAIAVYPSISPGVPTSLLEAAALGRPIIASRVEGIDELFVDGHEIRLVKPGDPKALAAAIAELLDDPELAAELGARARKRTMDEYSSAASVQRHLKLYSRLMKG